MEIDAIKDNLEMINRLASIPTLRFYEKKDLKKILHYSKFKNYKPGECIIQEGSFDNWVYFLITGKVKVIKHDEEISIFQRTGDIFGEMCIIDGAARSATVNAIEDTMCLAMDVSFVDNMSPDDKSVFSAVFYQILAEVLAQRLRETSEELVRLKEEMEVIKKQHR